MYSCCYYSSLALQEMNLPTSATQNLRSLVFHPRVAEEAQNLLSICDETLVRQLIHALSQTSADFM